MPDLTSPARRTPAAPVPGGTGRPPTLTVTLAALGAVGTGLFVTAAVALGGWFAADAGRYGDTRDAVRVGADTWLLGHGAGLRLDAADVTVVPLAVTLLCGYLAHRWGRRAAVRLAPLDVRAALTAAGVFAVVYAVAAMAVAVLASHPQAESSLLRTLAGGLLLALLSAGPALLGAVPPARGGTASDRLGLPPVTVAVGAGALVVLMLVLATAAVVLALALLADFGLAANVLARLQAGAGGSLMYTLVGVAFVPNALLLTACYLLGPGFAVGSGTLVSPTAVVLGPVPAFPLLAALPDEGAVPGWTSWLVGLPVLLAALGTFLVGRRRPVGRVEVGAVRGLLAGVAAAVVLAVLAVLAGGSVGPGRMAEVGAGFGSVLGAALTALGGGGLVGGALAAWTTRSRERGRSTAGTGSGWGRSGSLP